MKKGIVTILLVAILMALIPCLPTLAGNNTGAINITMTTIETIIAIELSPTEWALGNVTKNTEYKTDPEVEWCSINNTGTVKVDIRINGMNIQCVNIPIYIWMLSSDGTNGENKYALLYRVASGNYTPITLSEEPMKTASGENITLARPDESGSSKQFGLKLLTPKSFQYYDKNMKTHITISAAPA